MEKAVYTLGLIILQDQKIKSNNYHFLCVGRVTNILVLFLLQHLSRIERYSTIKIGRFFFCLSIFADALNFVLEQKQYCSQGRSGLPCDFDADLW